MNFNDLHLPKEILQALREQGYETPTPIQAQAIPPAIAGRDVLGCAQTGTGKTCAFAVPILIRLGRETRPDRPIRALVLTPTRELAIQNQECFEAYGAHLPLRSTVIFGGVGQAPQVEALTRGTDILVATPGRLADLHQQGYIHLDQLEIFVLDEADRMLDMGFIHDVKKILRWLPEKKQTLFFSATMPQEVRSLVDQLLHDPVRIAVDPINSTVEAIEQRLYFTDKSKKTKLLTWLLREQPYPSVLVFTRTKHGANRVARDLERAGIRAAAIHGNKSQTARQTALADFKAGRLRVLVATDIAARGLDIEALSCVINYNLPDVPETYVHRIGRTGRAGQDGLALSFCDASERDELAAIERQLGRQIPQVEQHPYPMEEMEVPMKDKRGRRVNPEDAEARAAAQEKSRQPRQAKAWPQPEPAAQPKEPAAPAAPGQKKRRGKPAAPKASSAAQEPVLPPEEDVGDYTDLIRHRAARRPPERKPYSASSLDELLALPDFADELGYGELGKERPRRPNPLSGGKVMDATARMFLRGRPAEEPKAAEQKPARRRSGHRGEKSRPAEQKPKQAQPEQGGKKKKPSAPAAERAPKSAAVTAKPPRARQTRKPAAHPARPSKSPAPAAGEAPRSLVRPYYLSDKKGKR
ncbi:MAG TPA: DEAD/DEAH box helicase [Candidatus Onthomonas avicola]|nr:DEAD/DEAH box helicase [Candidatus Onthomonas avicola]